MAAIPGRCADCTLFTDPHGATLAAHIVAGDYDPVRYECPGCHGTSCTKKQLSVHIKDCMAAAQMNTTRARDEQISNKGCKIYSNNPLYARERQVQGIVLYNLPAIIDADFRRAYRVPPGSVYATMSAYMRTRCTLPVIAPVGSLVGEGEPNPWSDAVGSSMPAPPQPIYGNPHHPPAPSQPQPGQAISSALLGEEDPDSFEGAEGSSASEPPQPVYGSAHGPALFGDTILGATSGAYGTSMATVQLPSALQQPQQLNSRTPDFLPGDISPHLTSGTSSINPATLSHFPQPTSHPFLPTTRTPPVTGPLFGIQDVLAIANATRTGPGNTPSDFVPMTSQFAVGTPEYYQEALLVTRDPARPVSPTEISEGQKRALRGVWLKEMERKEKEGKGW